MLNLFKRKDFIAEGLEVFRIHRDKEKIYLLVYRTDSVSFKIFGEVIHSRDLEHFTNKKINYKNQWVFILNFDRNDNEDIDNFYRFEGLELRNEFEQISESRFFLDISPSINSEKLSLKIRDILSQVYNISRKTSFYVDVVTLKQDYLPDFYLNEVKSTSPNKSFAWGNLNL